MSLDRFFRRYAELSLGLQPEALAALYAPSFIVGGPQGSRVFANDGGFADWLRQVADFNHRHGMQDLAVVSIRDAMLSPLHALATVMWGARFEKTGNRAIEFEISYLLEQVKDEWRILSYISRSDQETEMMKQGLV